MEWEKTPPYHVLKNRQFTIEDMQKADKLAKACSLFYNNGRAVPWFNPVCKVLKMKGSKLFEIFYDRIINNNCGVLNCCEHSEIEKLQFDFLKSLFAERKLERYYRAAEDIVRFYGAISRTTDTGKNETIQLNYNAEYVASDYASDIKWFAENLKPQPCRIQTFKNRGEVDFRFVKK